MSVEFNHTIIHCSDKKRSAAFLAEIFGLPAPTRFGPFMVVKTSNGVSLDFIEADGEVEPGHFAFLVSEAEFDEIFARIKKRRLSYWADPAKREEGSINRHYGGRGVYFEDPDGHFLEAITRPYGSSLP
jgi:catechol 2,3-dioxygenase-like lactoylglutathione lyase family enzyme